MGPVYRFGRCELDVARRELRRDAAPVALEPKVFLVLQELVAAGDAVVTKQELLARVWRGATVNEVAIARCISTARRAIGDADGTMIRTVHGLGYRFAGRVERDAAADAAAVPAPAALAVPEHKQVSVLSAALDDATAARRDLEARHAQMLALETAGARIAERHGGTLLAATDRGLQIVFGAPAALEDHAARALLAALELSEGWDAREGGALGIGVDGGPAVVQPRNGALVLVGDAGPGAAALAARATGGRILASAAVAAGSRGVARLEAEDDGALRVRRASGDEAAHAGPRRPIGASRLVGRLAELRALREGYDAMQRGRGRIVVVTGEPGIGKSRLVAEFLASLPPTHVNVLAAGCQPYGQTTPLLPLRALLLALMRLGEGARRAPLAEALERLLDRLAIEGEPSREALRHLLGVADGAPTMSPAVLRTRTFSALHEVLARLCRRRATVVVIEDLHWMDATSQAFLSSLAERVAGLRMLLVTTRRPGSRVAGTDGPAAQRIDLAPLSPSESGEVAAALWANSGAAASLLSALVARSGGNPFFLEELVKSTMAAGSTRRAVPDSIQSVLATRIDRLPPTAKRLLQTAAAIGDEVGVEMLRSLAGRDAPAIDTMLGELAEAELLLVAPGAAEPTLVFKHALLRDVAYESLVARERRRLHAAIADALEARFPALVAAQPERLAQHRDAAGDAAAAIVAWDRAADRAAARSAFPEALEHLRRALARVDDLTDAAERKRWNLRLKAARGTALTVLRGFTDPEGMAVLEEARRLCAEVRDAGEVSRVLRHLWPVHFARARYDLVEEICTALLASARAADDSSHLASGYAGLGATAYFRGEPAKAREHLEQAVRLGRVKGGLGGMDFLVFAQSYLARTLWMLGDSAGAVRACDEALATAESSRHPWLLVQALYFSGLVRQYEGDAAGVARLAERTLGHARENEFRYWVLLGDMLGGWAQSTTEAEAGIARIEATLEGLARMGTNIGRPYFLSLLADARLRHGRVAGAHAALDEALALAAETGERSWAADLHRLRAQALLAEAASGPASARAKRQAAARECLDEAIAIAAAQGAFGLGRRAEAMRDGLGRAGPAIRRKSEGNGRTGRRRR